LFGGLAKQSDIEKISFARVSTGGLRSANHSWDEVGLNRIGVDPVVEFESVRLRSHAVIAFCDTTAMVVPFTYRLVFLVGSDLFFIHQVGLADFCSSDLRSSQNHIHQTL
jgi:hypothetical protein